MLLGRRAECAELDGVLTDAAAGRSRVLVVRGDPGAGKSALLGYVGERAQGWRVAQAVAIESEMELAYSGLHQLCAPLMDHADVLPAPQRDALATVFGLSAGPAPDRFLVGLATLTLLADAAERQPLVCLLDDAQWLDAASAQIVGFVARRLLAERIAVVCAARTGIGDEVFAGLAELRVGGLAESDARRLLLDNLHVPFDDAVSEQIIAESHGNPLALLELPRTWNAVDLAGGFGFPTRHPIRSKIEQSYATRLLQLPAETQLLVLVAAAEPLGDPVLLHRAFELLGLDAAAAGPAVDAGLLRVDARVEFAHPLVRSAAYDSAPAGDRHRVHSALAEATEEERDPDRRAWHRARGTAGPAEEVAAELEQCASRAQARGGVAAAAAFLERAAALSPEPTARARRALAAADAKQLAGAPHSASTLLVAAAAGPLGELERALAERLKGQIAVDTRRPGEALPYLLDAARRLEPLAPALARETYLEAMRAGTIGGRLSREMLRRAAEGARDAPPSGAEPRAVDLLVDGLAVRFTEGPAAAAGLLKQAVAAMLDDPAQDLRRPGFAARVALDLFDDESAHVLAARSVQLARERGALGVLPLALNYLGTIRCLVGDLAGAATLLEEADAIAEAIGAPRLIFGRLMLAGFRGDEAVLAAIAAVEPVAVGRGEGAMITFAEHARARLHNGLGNYETARRAAASATMQDELTVSTYSLPELVEAAVRADAIEDATAAVARLSEETQASPTDLALGLEARTRALISEGTRAEKLYCEAIGRLARCRLAPEQARAHLLYGEWLRRERRRTDAREHLRRAHDMLDAFGMDAFAERARRELLATGETARRRTADTRGELTPQEAQIALLARDGYSNPEIGAQLFLSSRTVEWHLRKVFAKLAIRSRKELETALRAPALRSQPA